MVEGDLGYQLAWPGIIVVLVFHSIRIELISVDMPQLNFLILSSTDNVSRLARNELHLFDVVGVCALTYKNSTITKRNIIIFPTGLIRAGHKRPFFWREVQEIDLILECVFVVSKYYFLLQFYEFDVAKFITSQDNLSIFSQLNSGNLILKSAQFQLRLLHSIIIQIVSLLLTTCLFLVFLFLH